MDKGRAPIDLLRILRTYFVSRAAEYREKEKQPPIWEQEAAAKQARAYEQTISDIDATLRDWA